MNLRGKIGEISKALEKGKNIKPVAEKDGYKYVSHEDAVILNQLKMMDGATDMGERKFNPDGSLARSNKDIVSINYDILLNNRYRKVAGKKYQVVIDYRALKEQASGTIYVKNVPAIEISKNKDTGKLEGKMTSVSDKEFVEEFTRKLDRESMCKLLPILSVIDNIESEDKLDI